MLVFVIVLCLLFCCCYVLCCRHVSPIFALCFVFYCLLWLITPGISAFILQIFYSNEVTTFTHDVLLLYTLESALFLFSFFAFIALSRDNVMFNATPLSDITHILNNSTQNRVGFWVICILFICVTIFTWTITNFNYITANDLSVFVQNPFYNIIYVFSAISFSYLALVCLTTQDALKRYIAFLLLIFSAMGNLATGARIGLVTPLFFLAFFFTRRASERGRSPQKLVALIIQSGLIVALFIFFMAVSVVVAEKRAYSGFDISVRDITSITLQDIFVHLFLKFDSFSSGYHLIEGYGAGTAGFAPYRGSIVFAIPRLIYSEKPIAGSINDSYLGTPARLVPLLFNSRETVSNVGVSPLAIAIWHWGWLAGCVIFLISSVLNLFFINSLLVARSVVFRILAIYMIQIPGFLGVFPSPDVFVKHCSFAIGVACIFVVLRKLVGRRMAM